MTEYTDFLDRKAQAGKDHGFDPHLIPDYLFGFQRDLVEWALRKGRAAIFADCGMGKTPIQLVWAENVVRETGRPVLILTPLSVSAQTLREAEKFGIEATRSADGKITSQITVSNYERLHYFDASQFAGVVCDESSILKSFNGMRRGEITVFMRKVPYRLLCTATAAPNDYIELGTSSEALGYLGHMDMLNRFFRNDRNNSAMGRAYGKKMEWRLKGHAEQPFWRWVCSWARSIRRPSDMGYEDGDFVLPPLVEKEHVIAARSAAPGMLFNLPATNLAEQREELRRTVEERCEKVAELVDHDQQSLVWCHLNREGDRLAQMIPDAVQITGSDKDEVKESRLLAFQDGSIRVLVTKPRIGAWGLNFQQCSHVTFFPSHSFEQYYQGVRRCWRFGQQSPVRVDLVATDGQQHVLTNLQNKAKRADAMFDWLVKYMHDGLQIRRDNGDGATEEVPHWL